jgi:hypothetical protein
VCTSCSSNTYKTAWGSSSCLSCPINTNSNGATGVAVITGCVCNSGWTGSNGGPCSACALNYYKSVVGSASCTACGSNSNTLGLTGCASIIDCKCNIGYTGPDGGVCQRCKKDSYKATNGSVDCIDCPSNSGVVSQGSTSLTACTCDVGYTGNDGGPCLPCDIGKYKTLTGSSVCLSCPVLATTNNVGQTAKSNCICSPGNFGTGSSSCSPCSANYYKANAGDAAGCTSCPSFTISSTGSITCQCQAGYEGNDLGPCIPCTWGKYKASVGTGSCTSCGHYSNTTSLHSTSDTDCQCILGYTPTGSNGTCEECQINTYKDVIGNSSCIACPSLQVTNGITAASDINQCQCPIGYYSNDFGVTCSVCPINRYKSSVGDDECTLCPLFSSTQGITASTSMSACICNTGFSGPAGGPCEDIDECVTNNGNCPIASQCINRIGYHVCGPWPVGGTLTGVIGTTLHNDVYILDSSEGGQQMSVTIMVQSFPAANVTITYGDPLSVSGEYYCTSTSYTSIVVDSQYTFACTIPTGGGKGYQFATRFCDVVTGTCYRSLSSSSNITFRYPQPNITAGTLSNDNRGSVGTNVVAINNLGETVSFDGTDFTSDITRMIVYLGPPSRLDKYTCSLLGGAGRTSSTRIYCRTPTGGAGGGLLFTVAMAGINITGTDQYG